MDLSPETPDVPDEGLSEGEMFWRDRHDWLKAAGYQLRPRFHPQWEPSWKGTRKSPLICEDGRSLTHRGVVIDAVRLKDNRLVAIKKVNKNTHPDEVNIGLFLTSSPLADDHRNHCCPYFAVLKDPYDEQYQLVVMPLLRKYNDPRLATVGEAVEFFRQAFEGLQFMHEHRVAHRDCMSLNMMMDSTPILPDGFHPSTLNKSQDFKHEIRPYTRTARPVRYYWTDFGISRRFNTDDHNPLAITICGGDKSVPEFQERSRRQYNPFPIDVYYLGNLVRQDFLQVYTNLRFMDSLCSKMCDNDPSKRPTMDEAVSELRLLSSKLNSLQLRLTLVKRKDSFFVQCVKAVYYTSTQVIPNLLVCRSAVPTPAPKSVGRT